MTHKFTHDMDHLCEGCKVLECHECDYTTDCPGCADCDETRLARYDYIGKQKDLIGKTALGHVRDGKFVVQVDQPNNPWSIGWHETPKNEWSLDI